MRLLLATDPEVELVGECSSGRAAVAAIRECVPDLVFLDDEMLDLEGLRGVLRAFEVNAVDYILKPFTEERFRAALQRAKQRVHPWRPCYRDRLPVRSNGTITLLPVREIEWIDAEGDCVRVHVGKTSYVLRETMKVLEDELDGARFVRIHRSTIVNLDKVKELQRFFRGEYIVVLYNGATLKLSRGYRDHLEAHLGRAL